MDRPFATCIDGIVDRLGAPCKSGGMRSPVAVTLIAASVLSACIRSPSDVDPPGEGGFVSGTVLVRDAITGELQGRPGVTVSIDEIGVVQTTDEKGRFQLDRVPLGVWQVRLYQRPDRDGISRERWAGPIEILVDGQTVELGSLSLRESGGLSGIVRLRQDDGTFTAPDGTLVVLAQTAFQAVTDGQGAYLFPQVPQGAFTVVAFRAGFQPGRIGIDVQPGTIQLVRDVTLVPGETPTTQVAGRVELPDSAPAVGVRVTFVNKQDPTIERPATTDATGAYTATDVPVGPYTVQFALDDYLPILIDGVIVLPEAVIGLPTVRLRRGEVGDIDGDGVPDDVDPDRDNDGCLNGVDAFPDDRLQCGDTDGDGVDDLLDDDDDDDTLTDAEEVSPGTDGFVTDPLRQDSDQDGLIDPFDVCPTVPSADNDPSVCAPATGPVIGRPIISELRPLQGRVDDVLEIIGANFVTGPFTQVRFNVDGAIVDVPAADVAQQRIAVTVPRGAQTGPIFLNNAGRSVTSSQTFTFLAPPEPISYTPSSGRQNDPVVLFGRNFDDVERVTIGSMQVQLQTCDPTIVPPADQQALCFVVPVGATTGPISVTTANGETATVTNFVVLSGPQIRALVPSSSPPGQPIRIVGENFAGPTSVTVRFAGGATALSDSLNDREVRVTVPAGAVSGIVTVEHPAGDASSLDPLFIDNLVPAITDFSPQLARVGEVLTLSGVNLTGATEVDFTGAAPVAATVPNDGQVTVAVPADADPGPIYVRFPSAATATTPLSLAILDDSVREATGNFDAVGIWTNPAQTELYHFSTLGVATVRDPETLAFIRTQNLTPGRFESDGVNRLWTSPGSDRIVIEGYRIDGPQRTQTLYTVDPATLRTDNWCFITPRVDDMVFIRDRAIYIGFFSGIGNRLTEFNLTTGNCNMLNEAAGGIEAGGMYYAGLGQLHVYTQNGQQVVDIDPTRLTYGTVVQPTVGVAPIGGGGWGWAGLQTNDLFMLSTGRNNSSIYRLERLSASTTIVNLYTHSAQRRPVLSLDKRWVIAAATANSLAGFVFDSLNGTVASEESMGDSRVAVALPSPNGSRFVFYRSSGGFGGLVRVDIRD